MKMQSLKTIPTALQPKVAVWLPKHQAKRFFRKLRLTQFPYGRIQEIETPAQEAQRSRQSDKAFEKSSKATNQKLPLDMPKQQEQIYKYIAVTKNSEEHYSQKRLLQQQDDLKAGRMKAARARWNHVAYEDNIFAHKSNETQPHNRWLSPEEIRTSYKIIDQDYILSDVREKAINYAKVNGAI